MSEASLVGTFVLNRRGFLAALGATSVLVSSCGLATKNSEANTEADAIQRIVQAKHDLIADATQLSATNPAISAPLQVVIEQNRVHLDTLSEYLVTGATPLPAESAIQEINLPALATRCAVFSTNNLNTAISLTEPELSRVLALIAGSEMQHHALLSGFVA